MKLRLLNLSNYDLIISTLCQELLISKNYE